MDEMDGVHEGEDDNDEGNGDGDDDGETEEIHSHESLQSERDYQNQLTTIHEDESTSTLKRQQTERSMKGHTQS